MMFRVAARVLLHLGAELISSDAVALSELVKNAFDAGSKRVTIDAIVRIPHREARKLIAQADSRAAMAEGAAADESALADLRLAILTAIDPLAPEARQLGRVVEQARGWQALAMALREANHLVVSDTGEGMTLETLEGTFLTIGTRSRLVARNRQGGDGTARPILGEKGVGRLSTMRLGNRLHVESTTAGEATWNVLDIDWSMFSHASDALLEEFRIEPRRGAAKVDPTLSGTRIRIADLTSDWTRGKVDDLAQQEFSKLTDPFSSIALFPIQLRYNGESVAIPRFNKILLANAHATLTARFARAGPDTMRLSGITHYQGREEVFALEGAHLVSASGAPMLILESLGPFELEVYWYNRRILTALEGIGDRSTVLRLVREWGGGIMVFRDGFRVLPYGGPDDDWLNLDRRALASGGYKVNRTQLIGRLKISGTGNSALTDQTNREGLRDSEEKRALVALLKYVLESELRTFLDRTDREIRAREPVLIEELEGRVEEEERQIRDNLAELVRRVPEVQREKPLLNDIRETAARLRGLMEDVRELASSYEVGRGQLLNLAGVGLTVEVLAHELNRATEHALLTLADVRGGAASPALSPLIRTLEVQLRTLQKRLRILDQLSTAGRQRKEQFDVVELVRDTLESHREQFAREQITYALVVEPTGQRERLVVRAVKGMVVQVVENLITNSVYWLRQQRQLDPAHRGQILVTVDKSAKELRVTDNGPGVKPELRERVFEAFFSTKPAGRGKGLGLFIAREIARSHGEDLFLAEPVDGQGEAFRTFTLTLGGIAS